MLTARLLPMVIEMLTFGVAADERAAWLEIEETVWSRFLESQPGFIRKEMWVPEHDPDIVMAVIWWSSMAEWKAIDAATVAEVDERMGAWLREPTCQAFDVVREC